MKSIRWSIIALVVCMLFSGLPGTIAEESISADDTVVCEESVLTEQAEIENEGIGTIADEETSASDEDFIISEDVESAIDEIELLLDDESEFDTNNQEDKDSNIAQLQVHDGESDELSSESDKEESDISDSEWIDTTLYSSNYQSDYVLWDYSVYSYYEKTCYIYRYFGTSTNLIIPSEIDGYKVIGIDRSLCSDDSNLRQNLRSVVIPETIKTIDAATFYGCINLESVTFKGDSLESIDERAFYKCQRLKSIVFPKALQSIGSSAFEECKNLETITFKGNLLRYIGPSAFQYCEKLKSLSIYNDKDTVEIGGYAFCGCYNLETVSFNVKGFELENYAFRTCIKLKQVSIPNNLTHFWWYYGVFQNCVSLQSIMIPKIFDKCYSSADWFKSCSNLTVAFQDGISAIPNFSLEGSAGIKNVIVPKSVFSIGEDAFKGCTGSTITIYAENIDSIGKNAFAGCANVYVIKGSQTHKLCKSKKIKVIPFDPYAPNRITLKASGNTLLTPKQGVQLTATLSPTNARSKLTWKSSKKSVATVSKNGYVKAKKKGTTTITVKTRNGKKASIKITVKANPKKVTLSSKSLALSIGKTAQLTATLPKNTYATLSYSSSNAGVAKVDQSGKVTAVKGGQTTITVTTSNGKKASCLVTVLSGPAPTTLTLNATNCVLKPKGKFTIVPKINSGASTAYTYSTSNKKVATVAADGTIKAKKKGKAVITVRTHNGLTATVNVTVKAK